MRRCCATARDFCDEDRSIAATRPPTMAGWLLPVGGTSDEGGGRAMTRSSQSSTVRDSILL